MEVGFQPVNGRTVPRGRSFSLAFTHDRTGQARDEPDVRERKTATTFRHFPNPHAERSSFFRRLWGRKSCIGTRVMLPLHSFDTSAVRLPKVLSCPRSVPSTASPTSAGFGKETRTLWHWRGVTVSRSWPTAWAGIPVGTSLRASRLRLPPRLWPSRCGIGRTPRGLWSRCAPSCTTRSWALMRQFGSEANRNPIWTEWARRSPLWSRTRKQGHG